MYFERISFKQWKKDCKKIYPNASEEQIAEWYDNIQLPKTSTQYSAGHDFFLPFKQHWYAQQDKFMIPTGVRWVPETEEEKHMVLLLCPRSGWGTKYGLKLTNTLGVIDSDYCLAENEGHIMAMISVDISFEVSVGDKFIQGLIIPFFRCGETTNTIRTGGFGSTDK